MIKRLTLKALDERFTEMVNRLEGRVTEVECHQSRMQEEIVAVARDSTETNDHLIHRIDSLEEWIKDTHQMVKEIHQNGNGV